MFLQFSASMPLQVSMTGYLVEKIDGDFYNVVGLPVSRLAEELHEFLKKVQSK